jgi:hypothetical protein
MAGPGGAPPAPGEAEALLALPMSVVEEQANELATLLTTEFLLFQVLDCWWALFGNRAAGKRPRKGRSVY